MIVRLTISLVCVAATSAFAAPLDYPQRPVRVIVGGPAAGGADILARAVAQKLADNLGQQFVIDNRAGASGIIGTEMTARAAPDGYTLGVGHSGTHAINLSLHKSLPYHPLKDFTPLMLIAQVPNILVVYPGLAARTVPELIALAKAKPGQMTFASGGTGYSQHLAGVLFCDIAGVQMLHVPYKGSTPGITDVISGNVMMMFPNVTAALPQIKSGRLRALGVTSLKRSAVLPDVPAIAETLRGYEATAWFGFFAPAGLPPALTRFVNAEMVKAVSDPKVREAIQNQGADVAGDTPEQFRAFVAGEITKWARIVKAAGITPE